MSARIIEKHREVDVPEEPLGEKGEQREIDYTELKIDSQRELRIQMTSSTTRPGTTIDRRQ